LANAFESRVDVAVSAEGAWTVVGDLTGVPDWHPLYTSCEMDGDVRTASPSDGVVGVHPDPEVDLVERLAGRQQEAPEGLKAVLESGR
jgi:hypothetical protein